MPVPGTTPDTPSDPAPDAPMNPHPYDRGRDDLLGQQAVRDVRAWVESLDDATKRSLGFALDGLRDIGAAAATLDAAQAAVTDRVADARADGHTWTQIAAALRTSPHAAVARYGPAPPAALLGPGRQRSPRAARVSAVVNRKVVLNVQ